MNNLKYLKQIDNIKFYLYKPTLRKIYYACYENDEIPPYFSRFIHKLRMFRELYKSKYQVVYMEKDNKIIGHLVFGKGGSRVAMSSTDDIVIGPIWIIPSARSKGYGSIGIDFILNKMGLNYQYAYEYIDKDNIPSIRAVEKNGFTFVGDCNEFGIFKIIKPYRGGTIKVYRISNIQK